MVLRDRARGALLGLAVGDALGAPHEFSTPKRAFELPLAAGPHREMMSGGPFALLAGQTTDDTAMATCLATSLRDRNGFDVDDVAKRYLEWVAITFDAGGLTRNALARLRAGAPPRDAGRAAWEASGRSACGNGALMRTAPIGVFFARDSERRVRASIDDAGITHTDPRCAIGCAALNGAIAYALTADRTDVSPPSVEAMFTAAITDAHNAVAVLMNDNPDLTDLIFAAHTSVVADIDAADSAAPFAGELFAPAGKGTGGFARVALRVAFWILQHALSFEEGVVHVINTCTDTDTNAAIAGAMLGARFGENAIPHRWRAAVLHALADAAPGPFRDKYHPLQLLELAP